MATLYVLDVPTLCFVSEQFSVLRCCACGPVRLIHKTTWLGLGEDLVFHLPASVATNSAVN